MHYMPGRATGEIKRLRSFAPRQDHNLEALRPTPRPVERKPNFVWATNLDELHAACGKHGDAVLIDLTWCMVLKWINVEWDRAKLTHRSDFSYEVARLCQDDDRVRLKFPSSNRRPWTSLLPKFAEDDQAYIRSVASDIIDDWQRSGRRFLTRQVIANQHKRVLSAIHYTERNAR